MVWQLFLVQLIMGSNPMTPKERREKRNEKKEKKSRKTKKNRSREKERTKALIKKKKVVNK